MKKTIFIASIVFVAFNIALASDKINRNEFKARALDKLTGHAYQLHFLPLTSFNSDNFVSGIIEFSETEKTFILTLYRETDQSTITYSGCPYENSMIDPNRFIGQPPPDIVGIGFKIIGISFGRKYMLGIFQYMNISYPPVKELYLFLGN